jgi:hypothetical protein
MTEQEHQKKMAQGTAWLRDWVSPLADPITVAESDLLALKLYIGDPPSFLTDLGISPVNFAATEQVRRRALWTQLKNILDREGIDTTPMGIAYDE